MDAILLCAGYGTRLYPLTKNKPKPLLPVAGRPMLDYVLDRVLEIPRLGKIYVVTNDRFSTHFQEWAKTKKNPNIRIVNDGTKNENERLGAIGDLSFVIRNFGARNDIGIFAGDNLFHFNLKDFAAFAQSHRPHGTIGVVDVKDLQLATQYGIVKLDQNARVVEFLEKPKQPLSTLASTGIYWLAKEGIDFLDRYIQEGHNADRLGDYMTWLVQQDRLYAYRFEGDWFDIGDLDSYRKADSLLSLSKTRQNAK